MSAWINSQGSSIGEKDKIELVVVAVRTTMRPKFHDYGEVVSIRTKSCEACLRENRTFEFRSRAGGKLFHSKQKCFTIRSRSMFDHVEQRRIVCRRIGYFIEKILVVKLRRTTVVECRQ